MVMASYAFPEIAGVELQAVLFVACHWYGKEIGNWYICWSDGYAGELLFREVAKDAFEPKQMVLNNLRDYKILLSKQYLERVRDVLPAQAQKW